LFAQLARHNVRVLSLRNKANRLEELFMRLVENKDASQNEVARP
jgi:ABC-2 type transport system ATP-binding protein